MTTISPELLKSYAAWVNPEAVFYVGLALVAFAGLTILGGIYRMYKLVKPSLGDYPRMHILKALFYTLLDEFVIHRNLGKCKPEFGRWILHQLTLWGMAILAICTGIDAITVHEAITKCGHYHLAQLGIINLSPEEKIVALQACAEITHPLYHPIKIFYNVGAALFLVGVIGLLVRRFTNRTARECVIGYDWFLLITLTIVAVTGVLAEVFRVVANSIYEATLNINAALPVFYAGLVMYCIHIGAVFVLFVTIPFTKSAHVVYRFIALLLVNYRGVKKMEVVL